MKKNVTNIINDTLKRFRKEEKKQREFINQLPTKDIPRILSETPNLFKYLASHKQNKENIILSCELDPYNTQFVDWEHITNKENKIAIAAALIEKTKGIAFKMFPTDLRSIYKLQYMAVSENYQNLSCIVGEQDHVLQTAAIEKSADALRYMENQPDDLVENALRKDPKVVRYIHNLTEDLQLKAIRQDLSAYEYIPKEKLTPTVKETYKMLKLGIKENLFNTVDDTMARDLPSYEENEVVKMFVERNGIEDYLYDSDMAPDTLIIVYDNQMYAVNTDIYDEETRFPVAKSKVLTAELLLDKIKENKSMIGWDVVVVLDVLCASKYYEPDCICNWGENEFKLVAEQCPYEFEAEDMYEDIMQPLGLLDDCELNIDNVGKYHMEVIRVTRTVDGIQKSRLNEDREKLTSIIIPGIKTPIKVNDIHEHGGRFLTRKVDGHIPYNFRNEKYKDYNLAKKNVIDFYAYDPDNLSKNSVEYNEDDYQPWNIIFKRENGKLIYISFYQHINRSMRSSVEITEEIYEEMVEAANKFYESI